ncbi:MAG: hypothetical protein KDC39_02725 [Actinobacteria bacterium]|nr:hypothetical protein [Actinomycetota bacterium]
MNDRVEQAKGAAAGAAAKAQEQAGDLAAKAQEQATGLAAKAQEHAAGLAAKAQEHGAGIAGQVSDAIDMATDFVDSKTGGKLSQVTEKVDGVASGLVDKVQNADNESDADGAAGS